MEDLSAARHFCSAKILAGRAAMGDGGPHRRERSPRAKKFSEKICFAPSWVYQVCRTPRLESTQKYVSTLNWYNRPYRAAWGARGAAAPLFPKESRENPFEGFSLGNFFLTADAVLLCAAKKNGVGTWTSWHVTPEAHWPYLATAGNNKIRAPLSA